MDSGDPETLRVNLSIAACTRPGRQGANVELGGFAPVPVPVSSPDLFPKTLTLRTYTLLHH